MGIKCDIHEKDIISQCVCHLCIFLFPLPQLTQAFFLDYAYLLLKKFPISGFYRMC